MANVQTTSHTGNHAQEGFIKMMLQLNMAILSWGRFHDGRGPAMAEAFRSARTMLCEAFPAEAAEYERSVNEGDQESEVQHA